MQVIIKQPETKIYLRLTPRLSMISVAKNELVTKVWQKLR